MITAAAHLPLANRPGGRGGRVSRLLFFAVLLVLGAPGAARADAPVQGLPYAFAHRLGSGIYTVNGRTVQNYRFDISYTVLSPTEDRRWGLRLTLPLTIGFYAFEWKDVLDKGLPEHIQTVSVVPGVQFPIRMRERWTLTPYGEAGIAREADEGQATYVYTGGIASLVIVPQILGHWRFGVDAFYAGARPREGERGDYGQLAIGLDRRWPLTLRIGRNNLEFGLFGVQYWYWLDPDIALTTTATGGVGVQWEFGMTLGTLEAWKVLRVRVPRVGFSYRFGDGPGAWRFILGQPF